MKMIINDFLDKKENFSKLSFIDQVKYMAYFFTRINEDPFFIPKNIEHLFRLASIPKPANIADMFNKLKAKKIFLPAEVGFQFNRDELAKLDHEFPRSLQKKKVSKTLRDLVPKVKDSNKKKFLEEAIDCFETNSHRASIILTWLLTIDHLYDHILSKKLRDFNIALKKQNLKVKKIKTKDDFHELKESQFIEIARSAKIITNDVRKILDGKLGIRNSAAHPNDITFKESKAIEFIEDLIENVFLKYGP